MKYILSRSFALRGWQRLPYALVELKSNDVTFLSRDRFLLLFHCDGEYAFSDAALNEVQRRMLNEYIDSGVVSE